MKIRFTTHALLEMRARAITRLQVERVMRNPGQIIPSGTREVRHSRITHRSRPMLLRVVVEVTASETAVITAYRTSKITKYWRDTP